jgi:formylglycine-generating enzyme required for sulfatase activity
LTQSRFENLKKDGNLLSSGFVETLDLNHLKHLEKEIHGEGAFDWRREFYFSLPDEVKKTIALILRMEMDWGDALESDWSAFRDTLTTAKPISTRHEWVRPDFTLGNLGLAFRRIEAGRFTMRSYPDIEKGIFSDETPAHTVCISKPFYLGQFPVTQAQWLEVMNENPSFFVRNDDHPVDSVSWDKAQAFIAKLNTPSWWNDKPEAYRELQQFIARLNEETGLREDTGYIFRLPIEAEWEYACRAVSESDPERETKERWRWFFGDDPSDLEHYAWYGGNAGMTTHPVGEKRPNPWGLYDMLGNVWEWAWCRFKDYQNEVVIDPMEDIGGAIFRRGGSWFLPDWKTRTARRLFGFYPERGDVFSGFRLALAPRLG